MIREALDEYNLQTYNTTPKNILLGSGCNEKKLEIGMMVTLLSSLKMSR